MQADVSTLMATNLLASLTMAGVMVVVGWGMRREGLQLWAGALAVHAAGYLLLALRGQIDESLSILAGNALLSLALSLLLAAVLRFYETSARWVVLLAPPVLLFAALAMQLDNYGARVAISGAMYAAQAAAIVMALFLRRGETVGRGARLVMVGMGIEVCIMALRAAGGAMNTRASEQLLQAGAIQTATFLGTFVMLLVTSLGFIFMTKERADEANRLLAAFDALTGVANRRSIIAALDRDVGRAIRTRTPLALMMIDLDHFKRVNDNHGHLAGDAVLRSLVEVLGQRIRSQDIVGRYGGEEFLIVLPETTLLGARRLAAELCKAVAAHTFVYEGRQIALTVSIGVFGGLLEPGDSWDVLIHAADSALYDAKHAGRNRVEETPILPRASRDGTHPETFPASLS
ncbi:sensor domain-containing diguanylate cyclase [Simplicispira suum]|uniref:diguanylate cyclase n=1 Tax=Simplicispira suum TaxID=2109915 RepID=A0A2S0MYF3_9BURK|nr:GGDEF domain-containing protein [Simplicispira suum]AVO40928.1 GGDEF domain-containing protein [Simplicispira suum]MBW7834107.1 GGDEF domain-containing protein [Simplicispira suum]